MPSPNFDIVLWRSDMEDSFEFRDNSICPALEKLAANNDTREASSCA